jgi:hypothetical protein
VAPTAPRSLIGRVVNAPTVAHSGRESSWQHASGTHPMLRVSTSPLSLSESCVDHSCRGRECDFVSAPESIA